MKRVDVLSCVLALAFVTGSGALAAEADTAPPQYLSKIRTLDEVVVTGDLTTLSGLRQAMLEAENRFYLRFNELNQDRNLDIRCRNQAPTGSRVKRKVCVAAMADDLSHEQAMLFLTGQASSIGVQSAGQVQRTTLPLLAQKTMDLLKSDPELLRALLEHARLQQMYQELRKEKHQEHFAVWD